MEPIRKGEAVGTVLSTIGNLSTNLNKTMMPGIPVAFFVQLTHALTAVGYTHLDAKIQDIYYLLGCTYAAISKGKTVHYAYPSEIKICPQVEKAFKEPFTVELGRQVLDRPEWKEFLKAMTYHIRRPIQLAQPGQGLKAWLESDDIGLSSLWLAYKFEPTVVLANLRHAYIDGLDQSAISYPHDPSDFGRCHRLLEAVPEFKARLSELEGPAPWDALAPAWGSLTDLYLKKDPSFFDTLRALTP